MTKIYACLAGNWVCLTDDPNCVIGEDRTSPSIWWKEGCTISSPVIPVENSKDVCSLNFLSIFYLGKHWRINPAFIQIVTIE